jgi:hypothetical protein
MGLRLSKPEVSIIDYRQTCRCNALATHRCCWKTDGVGITPIDYPSLSGHWVDCVYNPTTLDQNCTHIYHGCDRCLSPALRHLFTFYPSGWIATNKYVGYESIQP